MEKEELKVLNKRKELLIDKLRYYKFRMSNCLDLQNRSKCPCCEQEIDGEYFKREIPKVERQLEEITNELKPIVRKIIQLVKVVNKINNEEYKEKRNKIKIYVKQNRNVMNKAIRDYNKGIKKYLPDIPDIEKEVWNKAMEYYLDLKNMVENDELYFEIKD